MKPTAMHNSAENGRDHMMPVITVIPRPKYSSTTNVGGSSSSSSQRSSSSASLTSPLQQRLSGDLIQVLGHGDGPPTGRGAFVSTVPSNDRKKTTTLIASRVNREPVLLKTSPTHSMKPPIETTSSSFTALAKFPHYQSSPSKSPVRVASGSPDVRSAQGVALPRTYSGSSAVTSPDMVFDRVNGYWDSSMNSEDSYKLDDFFASLPTLPANDFVSERSFASPPLDFPSVKPIFVFPSPQQSPLEMLQNHSASLQNKATKQVRVSSAEPKKIVSPVPVTSFEPNKPVKPVPEYSVEPRKPVPMSSLEPSKPTHKSPSDSHKTVPVSSPPPPVHQAQASEPGHPKSVHHRKSKKAPGPPLMSGIAENGPCLHTIPQERSAVGYEVMDIPPETFHVNVRVTQQSDPDAELRKKEEEEEVFVGQRDLTDGRSLKEKRIVGVTGTVRGFKNRVRAGIATFIDTSAKKFNYRAAERGQIVMYVTTMAIVRETYERCRKARNILHTHMVRFDQRDVYLSHDHQRQLRERLDSAHEVPLPQIFIDGQHLGGARELEKLNESGELRKILHRFPKVQQRGLCEACGGFRFVPCEVCHGSKKSLHRNHFTQEFSALRCTHCNENGLQRCLHCIAHAAE